MPLIINTNVNSLLAQEYLVTNQDMLSKAMQRLSSGLRINNAADDPAGLAIGTSMNVTSQNYTQGARNANDAISLVQTAQSAIQDISNILQLMAGLASQASSGTYSSTQLVNIDTEFSALLNEINRVSSNVTFNGINLLDGSTASVAIQVGTTNTSNDRISVDLYDLTTGTAGLNISTLSVSTNTNAQAALSTLDTAINAVTTDLAGIGASQVNLTAAAASNTSLSTSLQTSEARIMAADFAIESSNQAKYNILTQSNIAMLAQANAAPAMVLQLLKS